MGSGRQVSICASRRSRQRSTWGSRLSTGCNLRTFLHPDASAAPSVPRAPSMLIKYATVSGLALLACLRTGFQHAGLPHT